MKIICVQLDWHQNVDNKYISSAGKVERIYRCASWFCCLLRATPAAPTASWLIGVFIDTQTFSVPTSSHEVLLSGWARSAYCSMPYILVQATRIDGCPPTPPIVEDKQVDACQTQPCNVSLQGLTLLKCHTQRRELQNLTYPSLGT